MSDKISKCSTVVWVFILWYLLLVMSSFFVVVVAYPSGGIAKTLLIQSRQLTHMVLLDSFSLSYDFEFLFLSSVKQWRELFFCMWIGSCLPVLPNTFLSVNDLDVLRPGDCTWKGLFLGSQFYSPNNRNC